MKTRAVDLNCDCGESFGPWPMGNDEAMLALVSSANIACGGHAGDPETMARTIAIAAANGVAIGAHPGYDDKPGFGRRIIAMSPGEVTRLVAYQVGAIMGVAALAGARVSYVKAHGALSNLASADRAMADAIAAAVKGVDPALTLLAVATTELEKAGHAAGLAVAAEIFADRAYEPDGQLMSRRKPGAMIEDAQEAARRVVQMVEEGVLIAHDGTRIKTAVDSVCVHGDGPKAVPIATAVRDALTARGIAVAPFAAPVTPAAT